MKRYRVRQYTNRYFEAYQLLQEKRWWGWKTIDRVEVPSSAIIASACLGDSGWISPFAEHIRRES